MARPLRIAYPNAYYHVTCRGNDRRAIFKDDHDRNAFLEKLRTSLEVYRVKLHAYVLMNDYFHLLLETPKANLAEFMRHFNVSYTGAYKSTASESRASLPGEIQSDPDRKGQLPIGT